MSKIKISVKRPWIGYAGSLIQQSYGETVDKHGFLTWDITKKHINVKFHELKNPCPFITLEWQGTVEETLALAKKVCPQSCRIRLRANVHVSQKDAQALTASLKNHFDLVELTFKSDVKYDTSVINASDVILQKEDLRNVDVLCRLIRGFHGDDKLVIDNNDETDLKRIVTSALGQVSTNDDVLRNIKWSLRKLSFDNTFGYGEGNCIDFESLSGAVGVFGPNRAGKSSIVGSLMYALFNATDRGSIKNLHVINARKDHCYARAILNVGGTDYVVERQTIKNENKKGIVSAATSLNVSKFTSGKIEDLVGEQRNDTEKVIRRLIGGSEEFMLTSLSAQDDVNVFIKHGSTRRRQLLSKFLDLDIFDKLHDIVNKEGSSLRAQLKILPSINDEEVVAKRESLSALDERKTDKMAVLEGLRSQLLEANKEYSSQSTNIVTQEQVNDQKKRVKKFEDQVNIINTKLSDVAGEAQGYADKLLKIATLKTEFDVENLRRRAAALQSLESNVKLLRVGHEKEVAALKQQQRSLKLLDEVPCGDEYPTCKFIKDAHKSKALIIEQEKKVFELGEQITNVEADIAVLKLEEPSEKLRKFEQVLAMEGKVQLELSRREAELKRLRTELSHLEPQLISATERLNSLQASFDGESFTLMSSINYRIDSLSAQIKLLERDVHDIVAKRSRTQHEIERLENDKTLRDELLKKLKMNDLAAHAFSKKGLPSKIVNSQLPLINSEIAKILHGIVDYTIELEIDKETDFLEVYINYGDSKRIIELASGMEKMMASIAIRTALINVSTLPKCDMLIIDEGFGALDASGVEACSRLISSLKRHFKMILVITHVEGIKDAVDSIIEIEKKEKDCYVNQTRT
jgi:DNA repair exonuclease SbcCD ATPase subunit